MWGPCGESGEREAQYESDRRWNGEARPSGPASHATASEQPGHRGVSAVVFLVGRREIASGNSRRRASPLMPWLDARQAPPDPRSVYWYRALMPPHVTFSTGDVQSTRFRYIPNSQVSYVPGQSLT